MISLQRYSELFDVPGLRAALLASIVGRLPIGIATLAMLLFVQGRSGSFVYAGAVSACYVGGLAIAAPLLGRVIDRFGPQPVLAFNSAVYPLALGTLAWLVVRDAHPVSVALAATLGGAALPPVTICMRTLFPRLLSDGGLLQTAYSIDSALVEAVFILGPALVAVFVAAGYPGSAVLFAAVCAAIGGVIFLRSPALRAWHVAAAPARRSLLGPLHSARLLVLLAATVLYSIAFGLFEVAVTAFAAQQRAPAAAGVILGLTSVGSAAGALVYGSRGWHMPVVRQFVAALGAMALGILVLAPIGGLYAFAAASVVAGVPMATVIAVQALLTSKLAPRDMLAESFTWGSTCLLGGISAGIAIGGMLADHVTPPAMLAAAAAATLAAGAVVWWGLWRGEAGETGA